jgi:hypothetical protein
LRFGEEGLSVELALSFTVSMLTRILMPGGSMLRNPLCELPGIEVPIMEAPMGPEVSSLKLAASKK